jgi:hypothetical protein
MSMCVGARAARRGHRARPARAERGDAQVKYPYLRIINQPK